MNLRRTLHKTSMARDNSQSKISLRKPDGSLTEDQDQTVLRFIETNPPDNQIVFW